VRPKSPMELTQAFDELGGAGSADEPKDEDGNTNSSDGPKETELLGDDCEQLPTLTADLTLTFLS
jgi:hypothetical protein